MKQLADLSDAELIEAHPKLGPEARKVLGVDNAIKACPTGSTVAPTEVENQLARWKKA